MAAKPSATDSISVGRFARLGQKEQVR